MVPLRSWACIRSLYLLVVASLLWVGCFTASAQQPPASAPSDTQCIDCHAKTSPQVVSDWKQSKHSQSKVGCVTCHGADHTSASDVANVLIARPNVCAKCHQTQVDQYRKGKHSHALAAMKTQPNLHERGLAGGQQACAACHKVGSPNTNIELRFEKFGGIATGALQWGGGACDSCHSRHTFSADEARQPKACQSCHNGSDYPQWAAYASSAHGGLAETHSECTTTKQERPTCQTCHMPKGDHEVNSAWGYWGLALPLPPDPQWAKDRGDIMRALNILGPEGQPAPLVATLKSNDTIRLNQADWQAERDKMVRICSQCHSEAYGKQQLQQGDDTLRASDHLLAEAIRVVADLYKDGLLQQGGRSYPWLTSFDPPSTAIEQKLQTMYLEHRMKAFKGAFHSNTQYSQGEGMRKMEEDLAQIKELAASVRRGGAKSPGGTPSRKPSGETKPKAN